MSGETNQESEEKGVSSWPKQRVIATAGMCTCPCCSIRSLMAIPCSLPLMCPSEELPSCTALGQPSCSLDGLPWYPAAKLALPGTLPPPHPTCHLQPSQYAEASSCLSVDPVSHLIFGMWFADYQLVTALHVQDRITGTLCHGPSGNTHSAPGKLQLIN